MRIIGVVGDVIRAMGDVIGVISEVIGNIFHGSEGVWPSVQSWRQVAGPIAARHRKPNR